MPIWEWKVQALVFDFEVQRAGVQKDTVIVMVDDVEVFRCHYDKEHSDWVESKTAYREGHFRHANRTLEGLLSWLLGIRLSRTLGETMIKELKQHIDTREVKAATASLRREADELREAVGQGDEGKQ